MAVYDLLKKDLLTPAVDNPTLTDQVGQQSSRGVEGSLALTTGPVRVNVNGTVLRARFDDFNAIVNNRVVQLAGNVPLNVPERSANLLVFWEPVADVAGASDHAIVGRRFADNTNVATSMMPSYHVVDFGVRVEGRGRGWPSTSGSTTRSTRSTLIPGRRRSGCSDRREASPYR